MRPPNGPTIERTQRVRPRLHVAKAAKPHKSIRIACIAELADDPGSEHFLALDELSIEQRDEFVSLTGVERVLAQLNDRTTDLHG